MNFKQWQSLTYWQQKQWLQFQQEYAARQYKQWAEYQNKVWN